MGELEEYDSHSRKWQITAFRHLKWYQAGGNDSQSRNNNSKLFDSWSNTEHVVTRKVENNRLKLFDAERNTERVVTHIQGYSEDVWF